MSLSNEDLALMLSTSIMLVIGFVMGGYALIKWKQARDAGNPSFLILLSAILFFTIPVPWMTALLYYLVDTSVINEPSEFTFVMISTWAVPIFPLVWNYITAALFKEKSWIRYSVLVLFGILGAGWFYTVWVLKQYSYEDVPGSISKQLIYETPPNIIIYIYGASGLLFIFPVYLRFAMKSTNPFFKFRFFMTALSVMLFTIAAVFDAINSTNEVLYILIPRILLAVSLVCLFFGYTPPRFIRNRYDA